MPTPQAVLYLLLYQTSDILFGIGCGCVAALLVLLLAPR